MTLSGKVVNGAIVLDGDAALPEGARVFVELADERCPALEPGTHEEELAALRESIADAKAGRGGVEARAFLRQLAEERRLRLSGGGE